MPGKNFRALFQLLCLSLSTAFALAQQPPASQPPADLDAWVERSMKTFEVPGIAVAIVKDGNVVLAKGYGVRKLGEPALVDAHTLFGIASNTKAFTTAALAMLVDEGKISWDDPVTNYLPGFQMYDPYVTRELTIRDLVTHRSGLGLGAGDLMFFPTSTYTRDEILYHLRYIKPATSFRSHYAYDNCLYIAAGQIILAVTGKSWDDFVKERIFMPLGMTESNTSSYQIKPSDNFATPHASVDGTIEPVDLSYLDNTAPAGAINSSVTDIAKWLRVQLARGKIDGQRRLFSEKQSRETWSSQTILPIPDNPPASLAALQPNFAAYGLGFFLRDYHGRKMVMHTGGLSGQVSRVAMLPEENLGIVILTNQEEGGAFDSILYHVLDHYLKLPETDWIAAYEKARDEEHAKAAETEQKQAAARNANSKPSLDLPQYAGVYQDAWYGTATIAYENGALVLHFDHTPSMVGELEHWQYDTFKTHWRDRTIADAFVTFSLKPDGTVDTMKMLAVSPLADFSFDYQDLLFHPVRTEKK